MSRRKTISVVIPTYNCRDNLIRCLESIKWVNEIVIVDMGSTDGTLDVAKKYNARTINNLPLEGNFDLNRKLGMEAATSEWILKLDSDEELSTQLQEEIKEKIIQESILESGFYLKNRVFLLGKEIKHGFIRPNSNEMRLFRSDKWTYNPYRFHQQININGKTNTLKNCYLHYNYSKVSEFIQKTNNYTNLDAKIMAKTVRIGALSIIIAPIKSFLKLFLIQSGFLDKFPGLKVSYLFALYNLIEKTKIWEVQNRDNECSIN